MPLEKVIVTGVGVNLHFKEEATNLLNVYAILIKVQLKIQITQVRYLIKCNILLCHGLKCDQKRYSWVSLRSLLKI